MAIENVVFDLDETLGKTQEIFDACHEDLRDYLSLELKQPKDEIKAQIKRHMSDARKLAHVQPLALIGLTMVGMRNTFPGIEERVWREAGKILFDVYQRPISPYEDTIPVLETFSKEKYKIGVITHGEGPWTDYKTKCLKISDYLVYRRCYSARVNFPKYYQTWIDGADFYDFAPESTAMVGDNLVADAQAAKTARYAICCWLNRKNKQSWFINGETKIADENIVEISNLWMFLELVRTASAVGRG